MSRWDLSPCTPTTWGEAELYCPLDQGQVDRVIQVISVGLLVCSLTDVALDPSDFLKEDP